MAWRWLATCWEKKTETSKQQERKCKTYSHDKCVPLSCQSFKWSTALTEGELVGVEVVGDVVGDDVGDF